MFSTNVHYSSFGVVWRPYVWKNQTKNRWRKKPKENNQFIELFSFSTKFSLSSEMTSKFRCSSSSSADETKESLSEIQKKCARKKRREIVIRKQKKARIEQLRLRRRQHDCQHRFNQNKSNRQFMNNSVAFFLTSLVRMIEQKKIQRKSRAEKATENNELQKENINWRTTEHQKDENRKNREEIHERINKRIESNWNAYATLTIWKSILRPRQMKNDKANEN